MNPENIDDKVMRTLDTINMRKHLTVCKQCGSTAVGVVASNTLECESCGSTMPWDADKFVLIEYDPMCPLDTAMAVQQAIWKSEEKARNVSQGDTGR